MGCVDPWGVKGMGWGHRDVGCFEGRWAESQLYLSEQVTHSPQRKQLMLK